MAETLKISRLEKALEWAVYVFSASVLLSITVSQAALLLIAILLVCLGAKDKNKAGAYFGRIKGSGLLLPFFLFFIAYIFSAMVGVDSKNSFSFLNSELLKALACFALIAAVPGIKVSAAGAWYAAGATLAGALGIWQFIQGNIYSNGIDFARAHGKMYAVTYGETMAVALVFSLLCFINSKKETFVRKAYFASTLILAAAFSMSLSRGPAIGLAFALGMLYFFEPRSRKILRVAAVICFAALVAIFSAVPSLRLKLISIPRGMVQLVSGSKNAAAGVDDSSSIRMEMWKVGVKIIRDYPLGGVGPDNVKRIFGFYHPGLFDGRYNSNDVHNLYLQKTAEYGLPGGLIFVYLLVSFLRLVYKKYREFRSVESLWALTALTGFYIMMLTDSSFHLPRVAMSLYFMLALSQTTDKQAEG